MVGGLRQLPLQYTSHAWHRAAETAAQCNLCMTSPRLPFSYLKPCVFSTPLGTFSRHMPSRSISQPKAEDF